MTASSSISNTLVNHLINACLYTSTRSFAFATTMHNLYHWTNCCCGSSLMLWFSSSWLDWVPEIQNIWGFWGFFLPDSLMHQCIQPLVVFCVPFVIGDHSLVVFCLFHSFAYLGLYGCFCQVVQHGYHWGGLFIHLACLHFHQSPIGATHGLTSVGQVGVNWFQISCLLCC